MQMTSASKGRATTISSVRWRDQLRRLGLSVGAAGLVAAIAAGPASAAPVRRRHPLHRA